MNQNAQDLMMQAPSDVSESQLKELYIKKDVKKTNFYFKVNSYIREIYQFFFIVTSNKTF